MHLRKNKPENPFQTMISQICIQADISESTRVYPSLPDRKYQIVYLVNPKQASLIIKLLVDT